MPLNELIACANHPLEIVVVEDHDLLRDELDHGRARRAGGHGRARRHGRHTRCGYASAMKTKDEIVRDWLPRYTGRRLEEFGEYILLVNFSNYVEMFADRFGVPVVGRDKPMLSATAEDITILIAPKAAMFLFGTEMDFVEEQFKSGFTFRNPNQTGECGCGESVMLKPADLKALAEARETA